MKIIKKLKRFYDAVNVLSEISDISIDCTIRSNQLLFDARTLTSSLTSPLVDGDVELIVSLTTYSKRIHDVHLVVESIAQQTVKPNRLILWLDEDEFSLDTIPLILHNQVARGLEIRFCPNYRSYKKLIPTLKYFPNANVITIDDDVLYPHDMVEMLYKEHKQYPECIIGHRANKIKLNSDDSFAPYEQWDRGILDCSISNEVLLIGIGGIFYPQGCFNEIVFDEEIFMSICPDADDIWFKAMALLNNIKCKKVTDNRVFFKRFLLLQDSQDIALYKTNIIDNDEQIRAVFEKYDLYRALEV